MRRRNFPQNALSTVQYIMWCVVIVIVLIAWYILTSDCSDNFSNEDRQRIASELHEKKHVFGGSYREARSQIKSTKLDPVLYEDVRTQDPKTVDQFASLLQ